MHKKAEIQHIVIAIDSIEVKLEYSWIECGQPNAPLIVFLHEGLGSAAQWRQWPQQLCNAMGRRGLLFSRYGYGHSQARPPCSSEGGWPSNYLEIEARQMLPALFRALDVDTTHEHPILVGHSDGATIALLYAAAFPDRPLAVVALAPHVFTEPVTLARIARLRSELGTSAGARLERNLHALHDDPVGVFEGWSRRWVSPQFAMWNVTRALETISCPLLVIQGRQDQFGTLEQLYEIRRKVPHAELLVLDKCFHTPHEEYAEATVQFIATMLKKTNSVGAD